MQYSITMILYLAMLQHHDNPAGQVQQALITRAVEWYIKI